MLLVDILIWIIIIGFCVWAINAILQHIPMEPWLKSLASTLLYIAIGAIIVFQIAIPLIRYIAAHIPTHF